MIVRDGIMKGKHVVDMIRIPVENMEENEVDMKVQGGHLVCDTSLLRLCLFLFLKLLSVYQI